jgi:hypothetical protein
MFEANIGHEGVGLVSQISNPLGIVDPGEFAVGPDAESLWMTTGVIRHPDMRPVEVSDAIVLVEGDEHAAIADREVTRHLWALFRIEEMDRHTWEIDPTADPL